MTLIDRALDVARKQKGQEEVPRGSNRGPMVTLYQNRTGYPGGGVPWCLCFCYWSVDEACRAAGVANVLKKTGSCDVILAWGKAHGIVHADPQVGDIALILAHPGSSDAVHAFFVTEVGGGRIGTLEGNSNTDGSREGYEVVPRSRPISPRIAYVRWADLPGLKGVSASGSSPAPTVAVAAPPACEKMAVVVSGTKLGDFDVLDGETMVPIRELLEHLAPAERRAEVDAGLAWDGESRTLSLGDHVLGSQVLVRDGVSYGHVRKLVDFANETFGTRRNLSADRSVISIV